MNVSTSCILILIYSTLLLNLHVYCNIVIAPNKTDGEQAAYVFVQGASISAKNYIKYAKELQEKFNGPLWVGLLEFPGDLPEPVLVGSLMSSLFQSFKSSGFKFDRSTPFFFCGHSLGGVVVQNFVFSLSKNQIPFKYGGLILQGSFVTRSSSF
jgi:hypothetical protein